MPKRHDEVRKGLRLINKKMNLPKGFEIDANFSSQHGGWILIVTDRRKVEKIWDKAVWVWDSPYRMKTNIFLAYLSGIIFALSDKANKVIEHYLEREKQGEKNE